MLRSHQGEGLVATLAASRDIDNRFLIFQLKVEFLEFAERNLKNLVPPGGNAPPTLRYQHSVILFN